MDKPSKIIDAKFRIKLTVFVLALLIGLLICPFKPTGTAWAMGEKIVAGGSASAPLTGPTTETQSMETRVFNLINRVRNKNGLTALKINSYISSLARQHSLNMAAGKSPLDHQGFEDRTNLIKREINGSYVAENIAYNEGYDDPAGEAVNDWVASSGHLENIKGDYTLTGIGVAAADDGSYYFTQIFVR
jgi:uncharacterized protein YkwD